MSSFRGILRRKGAPLRQSCAGDLRTVSGTNRQVEPALPNGGGADHQGWQAASSLRRLPVELYLLRKMQMKSPGALFRKAPGVFLFQKAQKTIQQINGNAHLHQAQRAGGDKCAKYSLRNEAERCYAFGVLQVSVEAEAVEIVRIHSDENGRPPGRP